MLLVTTSHSLLLIDPAAGSIAPVHRGLGLYFGIATDGDGISWRRAGELAT
jgi:hypothetical protein